MFLDFKILFNVFLYYSFSRLNPVLPFFNSFSLVCLFCFLFYIYSFLFFLFMFFSTFSLFSISVLFSFSFFSCLFLFFFGYFLFVIFFQFKTFFVDYFIRLCVVFVLFLILLSRPSFSSFPGSSLNLDILANLMACLNSSKYHSLLWWWFPTQMSFTFSSLSKQPEYQPVFYWLKGQLFGLALRLLTLPGGKAVERPEGANTTYILCAVELRQFRELWTEQMRQIF